MSVRKDHLISISDGLIGLTLAAPFIGQFNVIATTCSVVDGARFDEPILIAAVRIDVFGSAEMDFRYTVAAGRSSGSSAIGRGVGRPLW